MSLFPSHLAAIKLATSYNKMQEFPFSKKSRSVQSQHRSTTNAWEFQRVVRPSTPVIPSDAACRQFSYTVTEGILFFPVRHGCLQMKELKYFILLHQQFSSTLRVTTSWIQAPYELTGA